MGMKPHQPKPLKCGETVTDGNTTSEKRNTQLGSLISDMNTYVQAILKEATAQQLAFTNQASPNPDECKKLDGPQPIPTCHVSVSGTKLNALELNFDTEWHAAVTCKAKTNFEKQKPSSVVSPGVGGGVIGYWKYECINKFIWITICNANGGANFASIRTDQACQDELPNPAFTVTPLCYNGFWCLDIKDPKGNELGIHFTTTPCVKKEEPKKEDKKDDAKKDH